MRHPSDVVAQTTFLSEDDKRFAKEQRRKRSPRVVLPTTPDGPCCARCQRWRKPDDPGDFGICLSLVSVTEHISMGPERGTVLSSKEAMQQYDWPWEYLPTRGFFAGCSQYVSSEKEQAA